MFRYLFICLLMFACQQNEGISVQNSQITVPLNEVRRKKTYTKAKQNVDLLTTLKFPNSLFRNIQCSKNLLDQADATAPIGDIRNPLNVAVASIEFANYHLAGVGSVVNATTPKLSVFAAQHGFYLRTFLIGPHFADGKFWKAPIQSLCTIEHVFNSHIVRSEILLSEYTYTHEATPVRVPVLLIRPDPDFSKIFLIPDERSSHRSTQDSDFANRMFYFSSAAAALMEGLNSLGSPFHIFHAHLSASALANALLQTVPSVQRPQTIMHLHTLNWDQGIYKNFYCDRHQPCNLMALSMEKSDHVLTVSKTMIEEGLSDEPRLHFNLGMVYQKLFDTNPMQTRISSIPNGLDYRAWNVFDEQILSIHTTTHIENFRFDPLAITESKQRIKHHLVRKGYIADASKPLFIYVGRYASEKGVNLLPAATAKIKELGASFISMGIRGSKLAYRHIDILHQRYDQDPDFYIMRGDHISEQIGPEKAGILIRAAADFVIVPSHEEAFGLVALESLAMGAPVISSGVSGMQDFLREMNATTSSGNAYLYDERKDILDEVVRLQKQEEGITEAITRAAHTYEQLTTEQRSIMSRRLIEEAKQRDWLAKDGSVEMQIHTYIRLLQKHHRTVKEL